VDIGCEQRTVVSECKFVMDVEDAVGKKVLFVANMPPTEVNGIMSHGKILLSSLVSKFFMQFQFFLQLGKRKCLKFINSKVEDICVTLSILTNIRTVYLQLSV